MSRAVEDRVRDPPENEIWKVTDTGRIRALTDEIENSV